MIKVICVLVGLWHFVQDCQWRDLGRLFLFHLLQVLVADELLLGRYPGAVSNTVRHRRQRGRALRTDLLLELLQLRTEVRPIRDLNAKSIAQSVGEPKLTRFGFGGGGGGGFLAVAGRGILDVGLGGGIGEEVASGSP